MRQLRPLLQLLALLFALGQGIVPGVAAYADGTLVAAGQADRATAHAEEQGGSGCHRVHTDACELCRMLSAHGATPHGACELLPAAPRTSVVPTAAATPRPGADAPFALPRGPPAA
jgi:hypothetical protein